MGLSFAVACQRLPTFVEPVTRWGSQPTILTGEAYRRSRQQSHRNILHDHALKKFNADDGFAGPVIYQACLASPLRSGQRLSGRVIHVVLIIVTEQSMQCLERRK